MGLCSVSDVRVLTGATEAVLGDADIESLIALSDQQVEDDLGAQSSPVNTRIKHLSALKQQSPRDVVKVKEALSGVSQGYGKRLKALGRAYVGKAEFQKFVAEAADETLAKVISRLAILAQAKVYLLWKK